ncbi:hypothetical protein [Streptomyces massasporeus]
MTDTGPAPPARWGLAASALGTVMLSTPSCMAADGGGKGGRLSGLGGS